jgi:hypothetical protein
VLKSPGLTDYQNVLEMDLPGVRRRWNQGTHAGLILAKCKASEYQQRNDQKKKSDSSAVQAISLEGIFL